MSEPSKQQSTPPNRARVARSTKRAARKSAEQDTTDTKTSIQAIPSPEALSQPPTSEPSIGERWGEFPPLERQVKLRQMIEAWKLGNEDGKHPGPFARFELTGADVFWLAAWMAGEGDVSAGKEKLSSPASPVVDLSELHLEDAYLFEAQLQGANIGGVQLERAILRGAQLQGANLHGAQLQGANLVEAQLQGANLYGAQLQGAHLGAVQLQSAFLIEAQLQGADLSLAQLQGANLSKAQLQGAYLFEAQLQGAYLNRSDLRAVDLRGARLDVSTQLIESRFDAQVLVADVVWNGVPLNRVDWEQVPRLGDEVQAHQVVTKDWVTQELRSKTAGERLRDYQAATRAYRQLAVALRGQGMNENADQYTYLALIMQRQVFWWQLRLNLAKLWDKEHKSYDELGEHQGEYPPLKGMLRRRRGHAVQQLSRALGSYLFSLFLAVLTGYGYRLFRIVLAYVLVNMLFAILYWSLTMQHLHSINFWEALITSVQVFHGRIFNPFGLPLPNPQVIISTVEAMVGLILEATFIAMLTQRFFNR